jgi:hypothetical protein
LVNCLVRPPSPANASRYSLHQRSAHRQLIIYAPEHLVCCRKANEVRRPSRTGPTGRRHHLPASLRASHISLAFWQSRLTSQNFSGSRSSTPRSAPGNGRTDRTDSGLALLYMYYYCSESGTTWCDPRGYLVWH